MLITKLIQFAREKLFLSGTLVFLIRACLSMMEENRNGYTSIIESTSSVVLTTLYTPSLARPAVVVVA